MHWQIHATWVIYDYYLALLLCCFGFWVKTYISLLLFYIVTWSLCYIETTSAQRAAHTVPVGVLWEMIRTMMPWLQLYTQILTNMKKRYCTWHLFIHIKTLILVNVYALFHVQELAFNEEENDRNKQVLFYFCFADISFISTFMCICCDVPHQIFPINFGLDLWTCVLQKWCGMIPCYFS